MLKVFTEPSRPYRSVLSLAASRAAEVASLADKAAKAAAEAQKAADEKAAAKARGCRVVTSFHDFYTLCPTVKLLDERQVFCAGRCTATAPA